MQISTKRNRFWDSSPACFFSVITPVFNRANTLRRTIESVKSQQFRDFEYIIVNDGSTEDIDGIVSELL